MKPAILANTKKLESMLRTKLRRHVYNKMPKETETKICQETTTEHEEKHDQEFAEARSERELLSRKYQHHSTPNKLMKGLQINPSHSACSSRSDHVDDYSQSPLRYSYNLYQLDGSSQLFTPGTWTAYAQIIA